MTTTTSERLLNFVGPLHVVGGLSLFAAAFFPGASAALQSLITGNADYVWSSFFATVLGPTIASWGVLFGALNRQFQRMPSPELWRAMLAAVLIWAPLDTALCLKFGVTIGAIVNSIVVVVLLGLLLAVKSRKSG